MRTRDGTLAAHYNVCRHRGSRLVPEGSGGSLGGSIRCPYHSWTYALDGSLRTAPHLDEDDGFTKTSLGLHPVGIESWGGFFFLNLTPAEASSRNYGLLAQLAEVPQRLRRYPLAQLRSGRRIEYEVQANWKVLLENYNECYHCGPVHPELCRLVPAFKQRGGPIWTGSGAFRTVRGPGPSPRPERPIAGRSRDSMRMSGSATRAS